MRACDTAVVWTLIAPAAAWSQAELAPIEVVGSTPFTGSEVDPDRFPANVQHADAAALDRSQALNLNRFLDREMGSVHINDAANNPFQPDLNYRGYTASPLLGLPQGLSVYQDGVRVNEPFGDTVNWDLLPDAAIADIEIVPGSNPVFGQNTLGGAINLSTKSGFSHPGVQAEAYAGDFGRRAGSLAAGGNDGRDAWFLAAEQLEEDGWRDFSDSEVRRLFARFDTVDADDTLSLAVTAADNRLRGNGALPRRLAREQGRETVFTYPDETAPELLMFNLRGTRSITPETTLAWGAYFRRNEIVTFNGDGSEYAACDPDGPAAGFLCEAAEGDAGDETVVEDAAGDPVPFSPAVSGGTQNTSRTDQNGWGFNLQLQRRGILGGELVAGTSLDYGSSYFRSRQELARLTAERGTVGSGVFVGDARTRVTARNYTASLFLLQRLPIAPGWEATLSGRYNATGITLNDRTPAAAREPGTSLDGDHEFRRLNLGAGLTWRPAPEVTLFGNLAQSSRAPTPLELTCANPDAPCRLPNGFVDDPPLAQVVATTVEIGARGGRRGLSWRVAAFQAENAHDIIFVAAESRFEGFFDNVGDTRRRGIELGLDWRLASAWRLSADYTFLNAEFRDGFQINSPNHPVRDSSDPEQAAAQTQQVEPGDRIPLIPEHLFRLGLDWHARQDLRLGIDLVGNSDQIYRGDESNTDAQQIDGFVLVHFNARLDLTRTLSAFGRVNNLFDTEYETFGLYGEAEEVLGEAYEGATRFIGPGAPRGLWAGLRLEF